MSLSNSSNLKGERLLDDIGTYEETTPQLQTPNSEFLKRKKRVKNKDHNAMLQVLFKEQKLIQRI